VKVINIP
jgi:hypothetical protein